MYTHRFLEVFQSAFETGHLLKCILSKPTAGAIPDLKNIHIRLVTLKNGVKIAFLEYEKYITIKNSNYDFLRDILTTCFWDVKQAKEFASMKSALNKLRSLQFKKEIIESSKQYFTNNDHLFDDKWYLFGFKSRFKTFTFII